MARRPKAARARRGFAKSSMALVGLWIVTAIGVVIAYSVRPAAPVSLTLVAHNVGFDVLQGSRQLLLADVDLESFTIASFESLTPIQSAPAPAPSRRILPLAGRTASLTVRPARLETLTAQDRARVVVNWAPDEPDTTKLTVSRQSATGSIRVTPAAALGCHGCDHLPEAKNLTTIEWIGRAGAGGTTFLLRRALDTPLRLSEDDIAVEGEFDTSVLAGDQRVSSIKEGTLRYLSVDRTEPLPLAARLIVGQIAPGTGRLKDLSVTKEGIRVTLEGRIGDLRLAEAGRLTNKLPSWLELGFVHQGWLYLSQGVLLAGGTAAKLLELLRQRREEKA